MELAAPIRELVERSARAPALHDAAFLELAESLGEHVRARAERDAEIAEALRSQEELADDEQRPALPDDVEGPGDTAGISVAAQARHGSILSLAHQDNLVLIRSNTGASS